MPTRFNAKNVALVCCFASLYTVFSLWSLFPVIGAMGKFITIAAVVSPLMGIILGPGLGSVTVTLGGILGASFAQTGPFGPLSFVPGVAAAFCSGLLYQGERRASAILYSVLLLAFAFYPRTGPAWLYPYFVWLQLAGLVLLMSPLQSKAREFTRNQSNSLELSFGVGLISFTATLFSHIVGCIMFELVYWPTSHHWQLLTIVYPIERTIITIMAVLIGAPLIRTLKAFGFEIGGK